MRENIQNETKGRWLVWFMFAFMFILAVTSAVIGVLVPEMQSDYQLTYDRIGYLSSIQNVGGFVTVLVGGMIADRFDKLKLIGGCAFVYTLCLVFTSVIPPYALLLLLFFVIGAMSNMESVLVSAYISQVYREKAFAYLNLSHGFFGAGSLLGPTYATILFSLHLKWTVLYVTLAVTCGVLLALYLVLQWKVGQADVTAQKEQTQEKGSYGALLKNKGAVCLCLACCIYMGQQTALNTWITSFCLEKVTDNTTLAGLVTSGYWLGITLGRFIQSALPKQIDAVKSTLWGCIVGAALLSVGLLSGKIWIILLTVCVSGICSGAAYPNMIGAMGRAVPEMTGVGTSALCITGTFGGILFPWLTAKVIGVSYLAGLFVCPVAMVLTALLLGMLVHKLEK